LVLLSEVEVELFTLLKSLYKVVCRMALIVSRE